MKRDHLAHLLRAAAEVAADERILVIGSQAILGAYPESRLPREATMSVEADLIFQGEDGLEKADRVEGAIGEDSSFHRTFGYYAQGVDASTAVLPAGWESRLVPFRHGDHGAAEAACLETHDLIISKLVAGREKDLEFARALLSAGLAEAEVLRERARMLPPPASIGRRVLTLIDRLA